MGICIWLRRAACANVLMCVVVCGMLVYVTSAVDSRGRRGHVWGGGSRLKSSFPLTDVFQELAPLSVSSLDSKVRYSAM